ncbi:hypothetical protein IC620_00645 [Hazenella sp. IB182357]|uniref:Uncharacterized protein n=1 Tax=Polycladospora coralii TaxID=2771432 RepID=A0A926NC55_9BACL|nr:hypothetical protein [Polycladospora coralii]MBD1370869.1 hypothetical protein [Polycladospora coralii]MBS7529808.1 hypothetical protein [Polycladospora coralii]
MNEQKKWRDLGTVESQRDELVPEEFPEGPVGAATNEARLGKDSPWREGQHASPRFTYEVREFHAGLKRQFPGSHPTHDDPQDE